MPGMLEQGMEQQMPPQPGAGQQPSPQPGSGPITQTPSPLPPQSGVPGGAPGPERPEQTAPQAPTPPGDFKKLRDKAIQLVYGDRFDQLIKMFQSNGPEKFARSMAVAVNTPITELEKEGPIDYEMATKIGLAIYMRLLEDMIGGGVVANVTANQVSESLPAVLLMYADTHPEVSPEDIRNVVIEAQKGVEASSNSVEQLGGGQMAADPAPAKPGAM
ncbi:MAG: hypothetical protein V3R76_00335 [Gammaproteobacteria bacterium]